MGDLVVGRITEVCVCDLSVSLGLLVRQSNAHFAQVQPRRWKVDANSRQDAVLMLSSVNLPGGVQVGTVAYPSFCPCQSLTLFGVQFI